MDIEAVLKHLLSQRISDDGGLPPEVIEDFNNLVEAIAASGTVNSQLSLLEDHSNYDQILRPVLVAIAESKLTGVATMFGRLVTGLDKVAPSVDVAEAIL